MGTKFAEIITGYFMVEQNDERLNEDMQLNPAQTMRRLSLYLYNAVPRFTRPPQAPQWLTYTPAKYDDFSYTATGEETTIQTEKTGYELCSVGVVNTACAMPSYTPLQAEYNPQTGSVTVQGLAQGMQVEIDFYTDGAFDNALNGRMKRILGMCMQYVWETRYAGDYLGRAPKAVDKSSKFANENEKVKADTERMRFLKDQLDGELLSFEQSIFSTQNVPLNKQPTMPI